MRTGGDHNHYPLYSSLHGLKYLKSNFSQIMARTINNGENVGSKNKEMWTADELPNCGQNNCYNY